MSRAIQLQPASFLFLDLPMMNGLAHIEGHSDIRPEELIAYEIGYRGTFFDRVHVNLAAFWHDHDQLTALEPQLGPPGLIKMDFDNRAAGDLYGLEAEARWALTERLTVLGNYTFQQLNWGADVSITDKDVMSPPRHKFMVGARYSPLDQLHLNSHLYFTDGVIAPDPGNPFVPRGIPSYFRLDLGAEYEFWEDRARVSVGVRNLLDAHHPEGGSLFLNRAEVPRMIYAELRIHFK